MVYVLGSNCFLSHLCALFNWYLIFFFFPLKKRNKYKLNIQYRDKTKNTTQQTQTISNTRPHQYPEVNEGLVMGYIVVEQKILTLRGTLLEVYMEQEILSPCRDKYDFSIMFWNCSDSVCFFLILLIN